MVTKGKIEEVLDIDKQLKKIGCTIIKELSDFVSPYYISTGVWGLDLILTEDGGLGAGCIEISGAEGCGKSTLAISTIVEAQKSGLLNNFYYIDMERALTKSFISCFSELDLDRLKIIHPPDGPAALEALNTVLKNQTKSIIILDSIPACLPPSVLDADVDKSHITPIPKLFSNFMPRVKFLLKTSESTLMLLNQVRSNISGYGPATFTPGGFSIRHNCDIRVSLTVPKKIKETDKIIGQRIKFQTLKNRFTKPYQSATGTLIFGQGFHIGFDLLGLGLSYGIIEKSGARFVICGEKFHGEIKSASAIKDNKEIQEKLKKEIRDVLK